MEDRIAMPRSPWSIRALVRRTLWGLAAVAVSLPPAAAFAGISRPNWNPGPPWAPLDPKSGEMLEISNLFWIMAILSGLVLAFVVGLLVYNIVHFTGKDGDPDPRQVFGNRQVEIVWTLIPTVILLFAFAATVKAIHDINSSGTGKVLQIRAIGHQWWWEFQYPSLGVETANEVHIPTGTQIHFHVESYDVIHSFWIPQLTRQIDANPGQDNAVFTELNTPGVYDGACYEYCGVAHAWMKFRAVVQSPAQFSAWAKHEAQPASPSASPLATAADIKAGEHVFLSNTCIECHAIEGTKAGGVVGPNLTHVGSRWAIAAGAAPVDKQDVMGWIRNPATYKQGVYMPGYSELSQKQLSELADYLLSLK
jgi:cytochrome c oxidase subunit II